MRRSGFTLVEVLVATAITLVLMGSVAAMFGFVSTSVTDSRAVAEMGERLCVTFATCCSTTCGALPPMAPRR